MQSNDREKATQGNREMGKLKRSKVKAGEFRKVSSRPNFPTNDILLPKENSDPRERPLTQIVLHFSSYAAIKPENPYQAHDIYQIIDS